MPNSKKKAVRRKASSNAGAKKTRRYDWKEAEQQASAKKMPPPLDFSADTHKPWRKLLGDVTTLAKARDIGGLKKIKINPSSSSPKAVDRYRKLCILALSS